VGYCEVNDLAEGSDYRQTGVKTALHFKLP
jgi:hypothetical protein